MRFVGFPILLCISLCSIYCCRLVDENAGCKSEKIDNIICPLHTLLPKNNLQVLITPKIDNIEPFLYNIESTTSLLHDKNKHRILTPFATLYDIQDIGGVDLYTFFQESYVDFVFFEIFGPIDNFLQIGHQL